MPARPSRLLAPLAAAALAGCAGPATTVGGANYAGQYSYAEFFAASDGRRFPVVVSGSPFGAGMGADGERETLARLLPILQDAKPRPNLTFTGERSPADRTGDRRPDYRLVLVFDAPRDLGADPACRGDLRSGAPEAGRTRVYAVYCRNDFAMSEASAGVAAAEGEAGLRAMFRELLQVVFAPIEPRMDSGPRRRRG